MFWTIVASFRIRVLTSESNYYGRYYTYLDILSSLWCIKTHTRCIKTHTQQDHVHFLMLKYSKQSCR